jgi:C4-dicarboxylate transporter DctQ subunit
MKLEKLINSGIPIFGGVLFIIMVSLTLLQVGLRQFFAFSFNWTDEVTQFCMTWLTLLGSIWVTKHGCHLNTGLKLHQKLKKRQVYFIDSILALIIAGVAAVVAYRSAMFSLITMSISPLSLLWVKMGYIYIVLPIAMLAQCYYYLKSFIQNLILTFKKND